MWVNIADILKHNLNIVVYDYRGYGKSGGEIDVEKFYSDAVFIYNKIKEREEKIILYGRSLASERLKKHLKPGDEVYLIDGVHHNHLEFFEEYKNKLKFFLETL